jgi:hypothetical protein
MNKERAAFHRGMLAALQHVASADFETLYREIVESTDVDELVQVAREDGQMTMSGLKRYGYGKTHPKPAPPDPSLRDQLIVAIAQALRDNTDRSKAPADIYPAVIQATGLRRAVWAALTRAQQSKVTYAAIKLSRQEPPP